MTSAALASTTIHAIPMTTQPLVCPAPVLTADFDICGVPGGVELWRDWGYFSPGACFIGYVALCTQTTAPSGGWPISRDETAVRCVPVGYDCNDKTADQRYAISLYNDITLSAPAFEIRWRSGDVNGEFTHPPSVPTRTSESATPRSTGQTDSSSPTPPSPTSDAGNEHKSTGGGMSAGRIAGIVIGAGAAMGIIAAVVFIVQFRRKHGSTWAQLKYGKAGGDTAEGQSVVAELGHSAVPAIAELHAEGPVKELASNRPKQYDDFAAINTNPVEMPGDSTHRPRCAER